MSDELAAAVDDEKIVAGYDPRIMRRLLGYARPYRWFVLGAVVALAIGTLGDLLLPVVIQRAVDEQLVVRYARVPARLAARPELEDVGGKRVVRIGGAVYIPQNALVAVSGVARQRLLADGVLDELEYYVFPFDAGRHGALPGVSEALADVGKQEGTAYAALTIAALDRLDTADRLAVREADIEGLRRTARVFFALLAGVLGSTFFQIYLMALTGQGVMRDLRSELFDHTVRQRLDYHSRNPVGRLVTRVANDVETVNQLFTEVLINLLRNGALMIGSVVTLMLLNWRLGLVTLLTLPPVLVLTAFFRRRSRDAFRTVRLAVSRVNAYLAERLSGMSIVQLFVRERHAEQQFRVRNEALMRADLGEMYIFAVFRPLIDLLSSVSIAVIIFFGARFLVSGLVSLGVLIAFVNLIRRFYQPVMSISEQFTILQSAMAGSERVFEMLDHDDVIADTGTHTPPDAAEGGVGASIEGSVEFDRVWFSYKEGEPVIRDLSFAVRPGETVAIVGYTGAGKTTIANLLTRLWDIQEGSIRLDGIDVRSYPRDVLRTLVQPIQQDVFLFSDTIRNNITLGLDLSDARVREVARMVQADHFIEQLPDGYDTRLTEGASNISTGQRQLLSFARILAHDPRIIIMDEATANIDTETERLIQRAVEAVMENRTALVIAHRLSTIKHADRILVLSEGRLVESGRHDELVRQQGLYYNLYRLQYQGTADG